ncbi:IS1182 family transposase [Panacibacter ginsenosidivorans]|uniref:IS1182 family transposase n=1 Tax=Panacibacter ginsenosidivorans TaxID=1813871 RepID=UPI001CEF866B|nr:IS1182 family transposase [Panacibacter ginsenosidivorans]
MQGKKQYNEQLFKSFQLSDRVPEDNFYRRLKELLDLRWLYTTTKKYYGTEGQQSIDPVVFFKLILIGYLENLGSDRRIINTVSMRLDMLFFIGYDIDEALPWHSTLSRTRQLYGESVFKDLFRQVLKQCIDKGMVAGRRQAMDSVAVKANASMSRLAEKAVLDDGDDYTDELNDTDDGDKQNKTVSSARKRSVDLHHGWKAKAYKDMPKGSKEQQAASKFVSNHTHYSTTDADARISVKPGKPRQLNYHAQVSVDTAHHVITQIQADHANKKDSQCLSSLLKNTIDNLQQHDLEIDEVLADAGYSSGTALQALEDNNIEGYIPNFGQYKPSRDGFTYDKENDRYTCSRGVHLPFKKLTTTSLGYQMKVYRSSSKDCGHCPLRSKCIGKSDFKKIDDSVDKPLYDRMHARLQTNKAKRMKKIRSATVEPVLGTLVNFLNMRRVNTRGIRQANKCMLMAAIAYNIKKLMRFTTRKVQIDTKALQINLQNTFLFVLSFVSMYRDTYHLHLVKKQNQV